MVKFDAMLRDVIKAVRGGAIAADAIDKIWKEYRMPDTMYSYTKNLLYDEMARSMGIIKSKQANTIAKIYDRSFDDKELKNQIAKTSRRMRQDLAKSINQAIKRSESLHETTRKIRNSALEMGADSGTAAEIGLKELYKTPWEEQARIIQNRLNAGINRDQLRYSYEKLIESMETEPLDKILKQQEYTMRAKLKQQATRLAQTETSRAINAATADKLATDPNTKYVKVILEKRKHDHTDVCDVICGADCGLGAGVYPLSKAPMPPFHPHCNCRITGVYINDNTPVKSVDEAISDAAIDNDVMSIDVKYKKIR